MTIPDLIWLSVGVAVAASLGWYHIDVAPRTPAGALMPGLLLTADFATETLMKGCLALFPVEIARRVRYGGPIKAVEFALLNVGLTHLLVRIEQQPWFGLMATSPSAPGSLLVNVDLYDYWQGGILAVSVLALIVAVIRRHRPPPRVVGLLLVMAYYGLSTAGVGYPRSWVNALIARQGFGLDVSRVLYMFLGTGLFQVIWFLPIAAALVEGLGRMGGRWTWVDRAAFGLPVIFEVTAYVRSFFKIYHSPKGIGSDGQYAYILMMLGSLGLAVALVKLMGPAWGRFFATRGPGDPAVEVGGSPGSKMVGGISGSGD